MPRIAERLNKLSYTVKQLAYLLDCLENNIYKHANQGIIPKPEEKRWWVLVKCMQGIPHFRAQALDQ